MEQILGDEYPDILGDEHPDAISAMYNLAVTLGNEGKLEEAARILRELLEKMKQILGHKHPSTILVMHNLVNILEDRGELEEAAKVLGKVEAGSGDGNGSVPLLWAVVGDHQAVVKLLVGRNNVEADSVVDEDKCEHRVVGAAHRRQRV